MDLIIIDCYILDVSTLFYLHIASHIPAPLSIVSVSDLPVKLHTCPEL